MDFNLPIFSVIKNKNNKMTNFFIIVCAMLESCFHQHHTVIIFQLLQKEKEQRLGAKKDFSELKSHGFFADINWVELDAKKIEPPYNPNVVGSVKHM